MTSLRTALVLFVASFAVQATAQTPGESCTLGTDTSVCTPEQSELFCDSSSSTWVEQSCSSFGGACDVVPCTGSDCSDIANCVAPRGHDCVGISPLFSNPQGQAMRVPCAAGSACTMNTVAVTETCTAFPAGVGNCTVADIGPRCEGDFVVFCQQFGDDSVVTSPGLRDCGAEGLTCVATEESIGCALAVDDRCPEGGDGSACEGSTLNICSAGEVRQSNDCADSGRACIESGSTASCVVPDSRCGAGGLGVCSGTVATICEGGSFITETDCSDLSRRCGPLPNTGGQIGCVANGGGGEGEGEGEGENEVEECSADSDCDDDEECDDGECRRVRTGRPGGGDEEEPAGLFSCANSGAMMPFGIALLAVGLRRRRRA